MSSPVSLALRAALPLFALTAGAAHAEEVTKSGAAHPKGEVSIVNVAGNVEVVGWDRAEVQVRADLGSGVERLDFKIEGAHTLVKVVLPKMGGASGSSDLLVKIPRGSSVKVNTVSADQRITGVRGTQRLQAVSGKVDTEFGPGDLEVKTVSGSITARSLDGKGSVRATSVSGDVQLDKIGPELDLNTVSGDMDVRVAERLERARIKTTNGNLELTAHLGKEARVDAEAINGDMRFSLRGDINAEFDIETFNGDIENCFGPKSTRTREYGPGNELRFTQGKGDAHVRVKTLNGAVRICQR